MFREEIIPEGGYGGGSFRPPSNTVSLSRETFNNLIRAQQYLCVTLYGIGFTCLLTTGWILFSDIVPQDFELNKFYCGLISGFPALLFMRFAYCQSRVHH